MATPSFDGFSTVINKLKQRSINSAESLSNLSVIRNNSQADIMIGNRQLILRQIHIPASLATKFYPLINVGSDLKNKKIIQKLRRDRWQKRIREAIKLANRYGAAYIVIQLVHETGDLSLPLDIEGGRSISNKQGSKFQQIYLFTQDELGEVREEFNYLNCYCDPEYYQLHTPTPSINKIHASRVLCFYGQKKNLGHLRTKSADYRHSPIWESSYSLLIYLEAALEATLAMLKDSNVGIYKLKGLKKMISAAKTVDCKQEIEDNLYYKIASMIDGASITNKLVFDLEDEDYTNLDRNYANVEKIVKVFETAFAQVCDLPNTILFSSNVSEGLFSDVGLADRQLLASNINAYQQEQLLEKYELLAQIYIGTTELDIEIEFPSTIELTEFEKADLFYKIAQTHTALVSTQIITPRAAARRYADEVIDASLKLTIEEIEQAPNKIQENNTNTKALGQKGGNVNNQNSAGYTKGKNTDKTS